MNLVNLEPKGKFVFVGDTHGDLDASQKVIKDYLKPRTRIIFLGDYVDRGQQSKENIDFLFNAKKNHPEKIYLLKGNHETYNIFHFNGADFWKSLSPDDWEYYTKTFSEFPLAVSVGNIIALHGALPMINKLEDINKIKNSYDNFNWRAILWGDFDLMHKSASGEPNLSSTRPKFGKEYFDTVMSRLGKKVLIRAHQPNVPERIFDNKCLTIFTSSFYRGGIRTIAIADYDKKETIESIDDLILEEI